MLDGTFDGLKEQWDGAWKYIGDDAGFKFHYARMADPSQGLPTWQMASVREAPVNAIMELYDPPDPQDEPAPTTAAPTAPAADAAAKKPDSAETAASAAAPAAADAASTASSAATAATADSTAALPAAAAIAAADAAAATDGAAATASAPLPPPPPIMDRTAELEAKYGRMPPRTDKTPAWQGWWEGHFKLKRNGKEAEIREKFVLLALEETTPEAAAAAAAAASNAGERRAASLSAAGGDSLTPPKARDGKGQGKGKGDSRGDNGSRVIRVSGGGTNTYGRFILTGTYNSESGQCVCERSYLQMPRKVGGLDPPSYYATATVAPFPSHAPLTTIPPPPDSVANAPPPARDPTGRSGSARLVASAYRRSEKPDRRRLGRRQQQQLYARADTQVDEIGRRGRQLQIAKTDSKSSSRCGWQWER